MTSSRTLTSSTSAAVNAWRNRGFDAGHSGREANPPDETEAHDAYMAGLRLGRKERERSESS